MVQRAKSAISRVIGFAQMRLWTAIGLVAAACCLPSSLLLANERIISDPADQLALFGFDPVAYLADGEARVGLADYEMLYERLVWRFANEGNMLAFAEDPQRFVPAYGGHGAFMVSRGAAAIGHPTVWLAVSGRVFLFRDAASRYAFLLEADTLIDQADANWPDIRDELSP